MLSIPVDPFKLAALRSASVVPRTDIREARLLVGQNNNPLIEYNPTRPPARIRFSICHELAHTLFPDWREQVRHRGFHIDSSQSAEELETLCNIAAAEMLLPVGSLEADLRNFKLSIDAVLTLRQKYNASTEAVLLRLVGLAAAQFAVFAAVPEPTDNPGQYRYRLEYVRSTPDWTSGVTRGDYLPSETVARQCATIGFTQKGEEEWVPGGGRLRVEMVATTPYLEKWPRPRVVGLVRPLETNANPRPSFELLRGDALQPGGIGEKIVAHVVNDKTANWGAGFGRAVQSKWPTAQQDFKTLLEGTHGSKLGLTCLSHVDSDVYAFQMVCQRGYGPSPTPRLRYEALRKCLAKLRDVAHKRNATVHMPKIGTGEAGGSWGLISNLIAEELCAKGITVKIYEPPNASNKSVSKKKQFGLFDEAAQQ